MKIIVYFIGLMLHIGSDSDLEGLKKHVAILDHAQHKPFIYIVRNGTIIGKPIEIKKGDKIRFRHGAGRARTDPSFREHVSHLKEHTRTANQGAAKLAPSAEGGSPHSHVSAYFYYPPSSTIRSSHVSSCKAKFILDDPNPDDRTVAVVNELKAPPPQAAGPSL